MYINTDPLKLYGYMSKYTIKILDESVLSNVNLYWILQIFAVSHVKIGGGAAAIVTSN